MSERETSNSGEGDGTLRCPVCNRPYRAGDRFCAECGARLPAPEQEATASPLPATSAAGQGQDHAPERPAWIFGARPAAVIAGGFLLLLLAVALLAIGQRDSTGTIVMLSICVAPLGLFTLAVGIARQVATLRNDDG